MSGFVEIGQPVSEKKIFVYGRGRHLARVTQMPRTNFRSPYYGGSTKIGFDDGRTTEHGYSISWSIGELII